MNADMNTDPAQIRADVEGILAGLPLTVPSTVGPGNPVDQVGPDSIEMIEAVGRGLEEAHRILVNALESVEKG